MHNQEPQPGQNPIEGVYLVGQVVEQPPADNRLEYPAIGTDGWGSLASNQIVREETPILETPGTRVPRKPVPGEIVFPGHE